PERLRALLRRPARARRDRRRLLLPPADLSSQTLPPLSILLWLPFVCGLVALVGSLVALGLAIAYIADYKSGGAALQHVTDTVWISTLGIHYKLAVTGLNVFLLGLTTLLFAVATLAANLRSWERPRLFYFHFMLAESAVLGAFLAQD